MDPTEALAMLGADTISIPELEARLEKRRQAAHDLVVLLSAEEQEQLAPCNSEQYHRCPVRCSETSPHVPAQRRDTN